MKPLVAVISGLDWEAETFRKRTGPTFPGRITAAGVGPSAAEQVALRAIADGARLLVSWGSAAGLGDSCPGDLVIATEVRGARGEEIYSEQLVMKQFKKWSEDDPRVFRGPLAGVDRPVLSVRAKQRLAQASGARAADMESHAIARVAQAHRLPMLAVRVVLDGPCQSVPGLAMAAVDGSRSRILPVIAGLLRTPGELPDLVRLGAAAARARARLSGFAGQLAPVLQRWALETAHG
ncbi:MAG: hypothetical protein RQ729_07085 [Wenzhouxiangellaceae bacterium]|nr:hypothetical protein [Wenzhouxiangellaceae bacterium]